MINNLRLGVNIDHVATIRNARGGDHPDPVHAAQLAAKAGADGITAHLREDRRHISDDDISRLRAEIDLPLNLEMAATEVPAPKDLEALTIQVEHNTAVEAIMVETPANKHLHNKTMDLVGFTTIPQHNRECRQLMTISHFNETKRLLPF